MICAVDLLLCVFITLLMSWAVRHFWLFHKNNIYCFYKKEHRVGLYYQHFCNRRKKKSSFVWRSYGRASWYYLYSKANKMHQCIKLILFWNDTLHVSDGRSVHHQEFKTVHTATKQIDSSICLTCLLLYVQSWTPDDGRKGRPKHSRIKEIWYIGASSWFCYRNNLHSCSWDFTKFFLCTSIVWRILS